MEKLKDLSKRFTMSLVVLSVVALLFLFASFPILFFLLLILGGTVAAIAAKEWVRLMEYKGFHVSYLLIGSLVVAEVLAFFNSHLFGSSPLIPWLVLFASLILIVLYHMPKIEQAMASVSLSFFPLVYISVPMGMALSILVFTEVDGRIWFFYVLAVTKINDVAAYFFGKLFGRAKLAPVLSPKKTYVGTISGIFFSILVSFLFYYFPAIYGPLDGFSISFKASLILGAILGVGAVLGDLSESLFKRDANVKDSNIFPGLGGILDVFDSLTWNIPLLYFYLLIRD